LPDVIAIDSEHSVDMAQLRIACAALVRALGRQ
jgi:hypothetical protein